MNPRVKNILLTIAFPLVMLIAMELIVYFAMGTHVIKSVLDIKNQIRDIGVATTIALALSMNLPSGRFDLSLGAQRLAATTIGGLIAIQLGFSGIGLLLTTLLFGLLFGAIVGVVFVLTRVPPMVLGIGMALLYETVAFVGSDSKGLQLFGVEGIGILTDINFTIAVVVLVTAIVMILLGYTKFGYHLRSIQGSQHIARSSGINVFKHAVLCYTFAGGLVSISGAFVAAFEGGMGTAMGFSTNGAVVVNAFPMFLGGYLARWSNPAVGILAATVTIRFFAAGLSGLKLSSEVTNVINMIAFLALLVFLANQDLIKNRRARKARIAQATAKKKSLTNSPAKIKSAAV